ncbi:hypothetical protein [Larkinella soli]|uniref:hypothetical protein n=1 Tax=Larkinella soli TaxID=1770527 RepID=UPI000FFBA6B5|nr:hypothetical protein [Larkinella soli]
MKPHLIFVYNAGSDVFSLVTDFAHKILSPSTYDCNLCALTYGHFGMKSDWKAYLEQLGTVNEFLHKDELSRKYGLTDLKLPAVLLDTGNSVQTLLSAEEINGCRSLPELQTLLTQTLSRRPEISG